MLIAILAWYVVGLLVVRTIQPFWPTCEVMLTAVFWPVVVGVELWEGRQTQAEADLDYALLMLKGLMKEFPAEKTQDHQSEQR